VGRLKINVNPVSVPADFSHAEFLEVLDRAVDTQRLPAGWEVDLEWRNPDTHSGRTRQWQSGEWGHVLRASTSGFSSALKAIIREEMGEFPPAPTPKKKQAKKTGPKKKAKQKKLTPKQLAKKRTDAAQKGWATRRAKAAAK